MPAPFLAGGPGGRADLLPAVGVLPVQNVQHVSAWAAAGGSPSGCCGGAGGSASFFFANCRSVYRPGGLVKWVLLVTCIFMFLVCAAATVAAMRGIINNWTHYQVRRSAGACLPASY